MSKIHVLYIIDSLNIGGAEIQLCELVRCLKKRDYRVTVCYFTSGPLEREVNKIGAKGFRIARLYKVDPLIIFRLCQIIRHDPPHIVHTQLFKSDFHGLIAARLCKIPIVFSSLRNCDSWAQNPIYGRIYGVIINLADQLIANSEDVRQYFIRYAKIQPDKIVTIHNGVDLHRFQNQEEPAKQVRKKLQIKEDAPLVTIVGRLAKQKDHGTFLSAAAKIADTLPNVRFLVVGDGPMLQDLEKQIVKLKLERYVIFTGPRRDVPAIMTASNLIVLSSLWEGMPNVILEGMAASRPIVATAVHGTKRIVDDGITGLLVPPRNPDYLAQACIKVLKDNDLSARLGNAGRERVAMRYNIETKLQNVIDQYEYFLSR